jgi:hypothetical protein
MSKLMAVPITLREANDFVSAYHRHNGRTSRDGGKFAIGVANENGLVGVAIIGNPLSATYMDGYTAEVLRVCTAPNSPLGTNSFLYSRCWQAWRAMGGTRLITYTLTTESGASLRGAGWQVLHKTKDGHSDWEAKARKTGRARQWQSIYGQQKFCWQVGAAPNTACTPTSGEATVSAASSTPENQPLLVVDADRSLG